MDVEHKRAFRSVSFGGHQPCVDGVAVGMLDGDALDRSLEGNEPAAAVDGEWSEVALFHRIDLGRAAG